MTISTRLATADDAEAIARIYNQGIDDRIATFETAPRSVEEMRSQLAYKADSFPTVVVLSGNDVIGYATAGSYRTRECYAGIAEHSVYVDRDHRRKGVGKIALLALCAEYADRGFWKLLSRIFPENGASLRLHEQCGFRVVGTYQKHAKLDGIWRDCVIVERLLP